MFFLLRLRYKKIILCVSFFQYSSKQRIVYDYTYDTLELKKQIYIYNNDIQICENYMTKYDNIICINQMNLKRKKLNLYR